MGIRKYNPTTPGRRGATVSDFAELTPGAKPEKSLLRPKIRTNGRNNQGKITSRHRGGGHKRRYRLIDFRHLSRTFAGRRSRAAGFSFGLGLAAVAAEASRRGELAEPVADHVFGDEHFQMGLTVVDHERVADELGNDRAGSRPRGDRVFDSRLVLPLDLRVQLRVDVRTFFE